MRIISKYKDYYDYLSGIYGEDPKLILHRRNKEDYYLSDNSMIELYIADYKIEGLFIGNKYLYGDQIKPYIVDDSKKKYWWKKWAYLSKHYPRNYEESFHIKHKDLESWCYLKPMKDLELTNTKHNIPILIKTTFGLKKYPKLSNLNLASFVPAETIYKWLSEWLSNQITNKEKQTKEITDILKIENKGFDKKRSFRPKMKK